MPTKIMKFETVSEGWVSQREPGTPTAVAAGSRCALTEQRGFDLHLHGAVGAREKRLCAHALAVLGWRQNMEGAGTDLAPSWRALFRFFAR